MTKQLVPNKFSRKKYDGIIRGISIGSFLQMLEQERHSCKVRVQSDTKLGSLYLKNGDLIDAKHGQLRGIKAAYTIVSWKNSSIMLSKTASRSRQIKHSLGYILLNAAKQQDEQVETITRPIITRSSNKPGNHLDFHKIIKVLKSIAAIRYFYLINRAGKIVTHSAPNSTLGELFIYCVIASSNLSKPLQTTPPSRIHIQLKDGSSLLMLPKAGKILGLILEAHSSATEVSSQISAALD